MGQLISELSHFNLGMEIEKIEQVVSEILVREFTDSHGKQNVFRCGNRLNFSCPYCGDSHDPRKKRGNFYLDTLAYKCYNGGCGVFKDLISFFKDFGAYNRLSNDDKNEVKSIIDESKSKRRTIYGKVDISYFFENDINDVLIDRKYFMDFLKLQEISGSKIQRYIQKRSQKIDSRFAWDPKYEKLYLFNLTPDDKIIGLQVRNMESTKGSSKYLTYKLSGIYEKILKVEDQSLIEKSKSVDPISHVFGIGFLDFGSDVTVFEGPMDSWLWYNSVGLCSVENRFPFELENIRFWYDWDRAGNEKSVELLSKGQKVFNWGKFLEENDITKNRKWDLNDLVIHLRTTGKKIKRFEGYFTNDALDLGYFIN
jgi:hypothetical protein